MIARRRFVFGLGVSAFASPVVTLAQQERPVPRIGLLMSETLSAQTSRMDALRAGLRDRGYVEGKNIAVEIRTADGNYERLPELAAELVSLKVDVIVAFGTKAVSAAKRATTTIPIVDPVMADPVALGISSSLAHPGGNITGIAQFGPEAASKRVEFLREAVPRVTRVAVLSNPANPSSAVDFNAIRDAANVLKLELQLLEARSQAEFRQAFSAMAQRRIEAIVVLTDTLFRSNAVEISDLAIKQRLPLAGPKEFAAAGGLIGYGYDPVELYRHAAYFVDRLLKGAKPGDLPIEQATKFDLVINLKTAKALGIKVPQSLLVRANDVIR